MKVILVVRFLTNVERFGCSYKVYTLIMSSRFTAGAYALRRQWQRGYLRLSTSNDVFPRALTFQQLATMMVNAQKVGFRDENIDNSNGQRIIREFNLSRQEQPTIAVIVAARNSHVLQPDVQCDFGVMCLQRVDLSWQTNGALKGKALMLTEVCRHKSLNKLRSVPAKGFKDIDSNSDTKRNANEESPIPCAIAKAESYACSLGFSHLYLTVEKRPKHGSGRRLLGIYGDGYVSSRTGVFRRGYGYDIVGENSDHWFLCKALAY